MALCHQLRNAAEVMLNVATELTGGSVTTDSFSIDVIARNRLCPAHLSQRALELQSNFAHLQVSMMALCPKL
jgi:hypothetical protein